MQALGNYQWDETYPNVEVFEEDTKLGKLWVAEMEQQLVGVAALTTDQVPEYAQIGWDLEEASIVVHRLAVDPAVRGQGIASKLMLQAETIARAQGIALLRVDTSVQNEATQRLFPKLGYVLCGEISLDFRPGLRVLCYEKRLLLA
jgi:ribosomal protein S18 acetylase RimI-like enzyme